ncbi:hypothetical protein AB0D04_34345 [Streptomyces sp. NPDC048483]|uniref:hypothetical protein n=1 Tax=Streptomyces sp. NPDC048483 TaxID=3154927 RepID=UPI00341444BC
MTQTSRNRTASPGLATRATDVPPTPPAFPPSARRTPVVLVSGQGALDRRAVVH